MDILIPTRATSLVPWGTQYRDPEGLLWIYPETENAIFAPVQDILLQPNKDDRTLHEKLRHIKSREKHPDEGYFRDNPVLHIKCMDDYWTPDLSSGQYRVWDFSPIVADVYAVCHPGMTYVSDGIRCYVLCHESDVNGSHRLYSVEYDHRGGTSYLWPYNLTMYSWNVHESRYNVEYVLWNDNPPVDVPHIEVGQSLDVGFAQSLVLKPSNYWRYQYWTPRSYPSTIHNYTVAPEHVDIDALQQRCHDEMLRALRYNELELYARSSKIDDLSNVYTPYPLQVALGEAWDQAVQPHGDNPGLPTLGFNNLQNLASLIDGTLLLGLGRGAGIPDALGELVAMRTSKEDLYERLASLGKKSKYQMVHDPDWVNLTPTQQRRLVKFADVSSLMNSVNASAIIADRSQLPDYLAQPGWDEISDAWFGGRYVWSTSWSDVDQAYRYFWHKMQQALGQEEAHPVLHGRAELDDDLDEAPIVRTSFSCTERAVTGLAKMAMTLYETGMAPTAAVMWDFVPFSFIVDWFFPVSNTLEAYSRSEYYSPLYYTYDKGICCSVKYRCKTNLGFRVQCYTRWYQGNPPEVDLGHMVLHGGRKPSDVTTAFRFTDGMLLLFRR